MKKTITMLLAATSVAMGATPSPIIELERGTTEGTITVDLTKDFDQNEISVVFTLDITKLYSWRSTLFTIEGTGTTHGMCHEYFYDLYTYENYLAGLKGGNIDQTIYYDISEVYPASANIAYSYWYDGTNKYFDITMELFNEQGELVYTYTRDVYTSTKSVLESLSTLSIESSAIENVNVYNTALDHKTNEVKEAFAQLQGGSSNIPEPTTATLSLLALSALAARRRRR